MDIPVSLRAVFDALFGPRLDCLALYPAKVVAQSGDTVEVVPDDSRIPGTTGVPIFSGTPGVRCELPAGTRVLMGFRAGDRRYPYVALWEAISPKPTTAKLEASSSVTVDAPSMKLGENAVQGLARKGDSITVTVVGVTPGSGSVVATGTITGGSSKVFAE